MDSLTHALTGAVVAKAINEEKLGPWAAVSGSAMGFFPDLDFVLGLFDRQLYLQYHRDFTHSLLIIPFYALFFGWLFVKLSKRPSLWSFYKICLAVLVSHVLLDLLTSYGTMIFSPFFDDRYAWDLVFIIDLIFSGIVVVPWIVSLFWKSRAARICRGSLAVLALYVLFCGIQHHQAVRLGETFAKDRHEKVLEVASLPQPLSPFRWANYVETEGFVYQGFVDLLRRRPPELLSEGSAFERLNSLYDPPQGIRYRSWAKLPDSPWIQKALATPGVKFYYWFARFPVATFIPSDNGTHRVEFTDVRFFLPGLRMPFTYYVDFDESGKIRSEGFLEGRKGKQT